MIGVFDSGLGGLTVLRALQRAMPWTSFLYLGDQANAPYGSKSDAEIHHLTRQSVAYLFSQGCELVVVACNTASAVALHDLQTDWLPQVDTSGQRRVLGVLVPMIEAMTQRTWGDNSPPTKTQLESVLLFATPATVKSAAFERELRFRAQGVEVVSQSCDELVSAIESGDDAVMQALVQTYVREGLAKLPNPQCVGLACTHYPLAYSAFAQALPTSTLIFSQPDITVASLTAYLLRHSRFANFTGHSIYKTTGDAAHVSAMVRQLFHVDARFTRVEL